LTQLVVVILTAVSLSHPNFVQIHDCPVARTEYDAIEQLEKGYCDRYGYYIPALITYSTWERVAPTHSIGRAIRYNPFLMEATAERNGIDLTPFLDGVALLSCADVGQTVWIKRSGGDWEGPFVVADCIKREHMFAAICYKEELVEVGFRTAERWGMAHMEGEIVVTDRYVEYDVEVYKSPDPPAPTSEPVNYRSWWLENARFTNGKSFSELGFHC